MQVNSVCLTKLGGKKSASKSSKDGFGEMLKGIEENGNISVMQLLANGFVFPQQPQVQNQVFKNGGQQNSSTQTQQNSGEPLTEIEMPSIMQSTVLSFGQTIVQKTMSSETQATPYQNNSGNFVPEANTMQNTNMNLTAQPAVSSGVQNNIAAQTVSSQNTFNIQTQEFPFQNTPSNALANDSVLQNAHINFSAQMVNYQKLPSDETSQAKPIQNTIENENSLQSTPTDFTVQTAHYQKTTENAAEQTMPSPMNFTARIIPQNTSAQNFGQSINAQKVPTQDYSAQIKAQYNLAQPIETDGASLNATASQSSAGAVKQDFTAQTAQVQNTVNIPNTQPVSQTTQNTVQQRLSYVTDIPLDKTAVQPAVNISAAENSVKSGEAVKADSISGQETAEFGQVMQNVQSGTVKANPVKPEAVQPDSVIQTASVSRGSKKTSNDTQDNSSFQNGKQNHSSDTLQYSSVIQQSSAVNKTAAVTQAEKSNVAAQVANAVKQAVDSGRHEIRLHLSPEDLGGINVKIVSQGGTLSLQITAESAHTGQLISSSMHELSQTIQNHGLSLGKTEVMYSQGDAFDASAGSQQQADRQNRNAKTPVWSLMQSDAIEPEQQAEHVISSRMSILA